MKTQKEAATLKSMEKATEKSTCQQVDLRPLASRTVRKHISVV